MSSKQMDEETLKSAVNQMLTLATGIENKAIAQQRLMATRYYYGEPRGDERAGRSSFISTDVADTIGTLLPALIKKFIKTNNAVEFEETNAQGEQEAYQKTQIANYVFYKENDGFTILYDAIFDALLLKNAYFKCYSEDKLDVTTETYEGLTEDEYTLLIAAPDFDTVEVIKHTEKNGLHSIKLRNNKKSRITRIEVVPPEEMILSSTAVSLDRAQVRGQRTRMRKSDLVELGIKIETLNLTSLSNGAASFEEQERFRDEGIVIYDRGLTSDKSTEEVWVTDLYPYLDYDGDGIAEMRHIRVIGEDATNIVLNEEVDSHPYITFSPIRIPHRHYGRSIADITMDIQDGRTSAYRLAFDSLYLANHKRTLIRRTSKTDVDAYITGRVGGIVMTDDPTGVVPLDNNDIGQSVFQLIDQFRQLREDRTGQSKDMTGSDPNSIDRTLGEVNIVENKSQEREDLIAALIGEGLKNLFRKIIEIEAKEGCSPRLIKSIMGWESIDPREWKYECNVTLNVGLGTGNKDQMLGHLGAISQFQQLLAGSQAYSSLVSLENAYNTGAEMVKNSGLIDPTKYFTDPNAQAKPGEQSKPSSQQMQQQQAQQQQVQQQQQLQFENQMKAQELELRKQKLDIEQMKVQLDDQIQKARLELDTEKNLAEIQLQKLDLAHKHATAPVFPPIPPLRPENV